MASYCASCTECSGHRLKKKNTSKKFCFQISVVISGLCTTQKNRKCQKKNRSILINKACFETKTCRDNRM